MDVSWPPRADFDEATYRRETIERGLGKGARSWPGDTRTVKLNQRVVDVCGISRDDVRKLEESEKIQMLLDKQREKYVTPLEKISEFTETFRAFVAYPIPLDEVARVLKTIVAMAHGDSLLTNRHCAVVDLRVVRRLRREYLEAEQKGEIGNPENFFISGGVNREDRGFEVGKKLTTLLMEAPDLPECVKQVRGRLSILFEGDAKLNVDSLLTATDVARCYVISGAVKDVENTKEAAAGRIVVTCLLEGEVWHVLGTPAHFAMLNPFTINCFMTLAEIFWPTLSLGYRQSTSLVPPVKMVTSGDGGVMVGEAPDKEMKASVKWAFPKTIRQMDGVMARAVKVIGENNITDAPARLLARRVASASSGKLASLESRDDGLPNGFGVDVDVFTKLIDSMKGVADISKAVGPLGHILCSCPTPPPPPPPPPPPNPTTNVNGVNLGHNWTNQEHVDTGQGQG